MNGKMRNANRIIIIGSITGRANNPNISTRIQKMTPTGSKTAKQTGRSNNDNINAKNANRSLKTNFIAKRKILTNTSANKKAAKTLHIVIIVFIKSALISNYYYTIILCQNNSI